MGPKQVATLAHSLFDKARREQTESKTLFCMPNFFIAGFPKSGTTSLDAALRQHPQIANPGRKEVHWWTRIPLQDLNQTYLQLAVLKYLIHYSYAAKEIKVHKDSITYDGSQSTLWDSQNFVSNGPDYCTMPAVISQVLPKAKFVVVMRNPITRLYSHFLYGCSNHRGQNITKWPEKIRTDPAGKFHQEVVLDIQQFNECLHRFSLYECVSENRYLGNKCGGVGNKLTVSMYYVHLFKWLQFYPKKQFVFLRMENMDIDPHAFLSRITKFLGLHAISPKQAQQWFTTKMNVQDAATKNPSKFTMWNETWRLLEDFYTPYNAMLAKLTADKTFLWSD